LYRSERLNSSIAFFENLIFDEGYLEFTSIDLLTLFRDCISISWDDDDTIFIRNDDVARAPVAPAHSTGTFRATA
jgi:hypothetical protein